VDCPFLLPTFAAELRATAPYPQLRSDSVAIDLPRPVPDPSPCPALLDLPFRTRMNSTRIFVCTLFAALHVAVAHERVASQGLPETPKPAEAKPRPLPDEKDLHRPGRTPDRIILTWNGDPSTSQAVNWRTDSSVERAVAELTIAEGGSLFEKKALRFPAATERLDSDLGTAHYHSVTFQGLTPATKYIYRVGDGEVWSEWIHFRSASCEPEPFSFIYFGDAQNDIKRHWSRVIREAYSDAPRARFMIHAGDLVNNSRKDAEWGEWFQAGGWMNAMVPSVPAVGNHEYTKDPKNDKLPASVSPHWRAQFTLSPSAIAGLDETCYSLDYQGARIICLNSNEKLVEQAEWLEVQLRNNPSTWTVIAFHHPIFSAAKSRDNPRVRSEWKSVFDKYRVDLVLTGHDHTYARSRPTREINVASGLNKRSIDSGTVYVVSVSGPKAYGAERYPFTQRIAEDTQLYQIIHVHPTHLLYEAKMANGELYDSFELRKRPGDINEFIERAPAIPERLRSNATP